MLVRVEEPMRVAPGGHVIDLKAGETATGALAEYLVASRCNVTVVEDDHTDTGSADGALEAGLTATADVLNAAEAAKTTKAPKAAKA